MEAAASAEPRQEETAAAEAAEDGAEAAEGAEEAEAAEADGGQRAKGRGAAAESGQERGGRHLGRAAASSAHAREDGDSSAHVQSWNVCACVSFHPIGVRRTPHAQCGSASSCRTVRGRLWAVLKEKGGKLGPMRERSDHFDWRGNQS